MTSRYLTEVSHHRPGCVNMKQQHSNNSQFDHLYVFHILVLNTGDLRSRINKIVFYMSKSLCWNVHIVT